MKNKGKEKVVKCGQVLQCVIRGGKNWLLNKGTQVWGYRVGRPIKKNETKRKG